MSLKKMFLIATLLPFLLTVSPFAKERPQRRYKIRDLESAQIEMGKHKKTWWRKTERILLAVGTLGLIFWLPGSGYRFSLRTDNVRVEIGKGAPSN
ncbi:hypothetical protein BVX98_04625 [bacterium F11]|nr:hypothetical protein BVX98_04625 [bacterium F11]